MMNLVEIHVYSSHGMPLKLKAWPEAPVDWAELQREAVSECVETLAWEVDAGSPEELMEAYPEFEYEVTKSLRWEAISA